MLVFMRGAEIGIGGRPHAAGLPDGSQKAPGGGTVHARPHSGCGIALVRRRRKSIMTAVGFEPTPLRTGAWSQRLRPLGQTVLTKWPLVLVGQALCTSIHTTARKHSRILPGEWWAVPCRCGSDVWGAASSCIMYRPKSGLRSHGYIAQWLERLTADQQVPGSNPGVPFCLYVLLTSIDRKPSVQKSGHPESNQGPSDGCMDLQSDALPAEL